MVANDDSFEIAQDLLDFTPNDENATINKWIEKLAQIRQRLMERCRQMSDTLDEMVATHAEEMKQCVQQHEENLAEAENEKAQLLAFLNKLHNENNTKADECQNAFELLRSIHDRKYFCRFPNGICI